MKIPCPKCGNVIVIDTGGRKKVNISTTKVCSALVVGKNGKPRWKETAKVIFREFGVEVGGDFVQIRVQRYLAENNITLKEFLVPIIAKKEIGKRKQRINEKMMEADNGN